MKSIRTWYPLDGSLQRRQGSVGLTVVSASNVTDTTVTLSWTAVAGVTGYLVGRDGSDSHGNGAYQTTESASTLSQSMVWLIPNTSYTLYCQPLPGGVKQTVTITTAATSTEPAGPQNDMVGWIGDSLTAQDPTESGNSTEGPTHITAALVAAGWSGSSQVSGLSGRKIRDGSPNPATPTQISTWRSSGFDPSTWVFALGNNSWNDGTVKWISDINANLDDVASGGGTYTVFLFSMTGSPQSNDPLHYYSTLQSIAASNTRNNMTVYAVDLDHMLHTGLDESAWWQSGGVHMTATGYTYRNKRMVDAIGGPVYNGPPTGSTNYSTLSGSGVAAKINSAGKVNVSLPSGTYQTSDFTDAAGYASMWVHGGGSDNQTGGPVGLYGPANRSATFQVTPNTSTKVSTLPPSGSNQNNNYHILRTDGVTRISGLTIQGTPQGMPYHGLYIYKTANVICSDINVIAVPGEEPAVPPGETYGICQYQSLNTRYYRINATGPNSAVGLCPVSNSNDTVITDSVFNNFQTSAPAVAWGVTNITYHRCVFENSPHRGLNFERVGGVAIISECTWHNVQTTIHLEVDNDQGSAYVAIIDPVFEGSTFQVRLGGTYFGNPNLQKASDIHLFVNGVERADLLTVHS